MCCCAGAASFTRGGEGVAGPKEIWNVGNAQGKGVKACYEAVKSDARCPSPKYFTYVARADQNCGCKGSSGSLTIRADANADYYRIEDGGNMGGTICKCDRYFGLGAGCSGSGGSLTAALKGLNNCAVLRLL